MEIDPSTTHPHPHPIPHPHHRKIELQSPLDLVYLQHNTAASVRQKLDLHFPPSASQSLPLPSSSSSAAGERSLCASHPVTIDPMRQRVEQLVTDFLDRMWSAAKANVVVNGQDATALSDAVPASGSVAAEREDREGVDFEYEAYDARLSGKVAALYAELEGLTTLVARLRRTAPADAADKYGQALRAVLQQEAEKGERTKAEVRVGGGLRLEGMRDGWEEDVAAVYERGLSELGSLGGQAGGEARSSLTETVGRVQRAKQVALEFA